MNLLKKTQVYIWVKHFFLFKYWRQFDTNKSFQRKIKYLTHSSKFSVFSYCQINCFYIFSYLIEIIYSQTHILFSLNNNKKCYIKLFPSKYLLWASFWKTGKWFIYFLRVYLFGVLNHIVDLISSNLFYGN